MDIQIGRIVSYYSKTGVAVIEILNQALKHGDAIRVRGPETDYVQTVTMLRRGYSMVSEVPAGDTCVTSVTQAVAPGDMVYLLTHHE